jgi:hypothetical protein
MLPPLLNTSVKCSPGPTFSEPLNIMCSKRCAKPVRRAFLVGRADVVGDGDGEGRGGMVLRHDDPETVLELDVG